MSVKTDNATKFQQIENERNKIQEIQDLNGNVSSAINQLQEEPLIQKTSDEELTKSEVIKNEKVEPKQPGFYALFVLAAVTAVRTCYVVQKNSIGYAYGFEGVGDKANNPVFMLQAAYPQLGPIYGLVASLMFSAAYSTSNIFMSSQSKNWNKRVMLGLGVVCFSLTSLIAGASNSLAVFAIMRFFFGLAASSINAPIY